MTNSLMPRLSAVASSFTCGSTCSITNWAECAPLCMASVTVCALVSRLKACPIVADWMTSSWRVSSLKMKRAFTGSVRTAGANLARYPVIAC